MSDDPTARTQHFHCLLLFAQMDMVVGTPLRMAKLARKQKGVFGGVEFVVLDEADKLLGEAFLSQVDAILAACTHPRKACRPRPLHDQRG